MKDFITKTEAQKHYVLKNISKTIKNRSLGTLYYDMFEKEKDIEFKESMPMEIGIVWLCSGYVDSAEFPKYKCPCWRVIGHWRHYKKSNKTIFINGYWKGSERLTKQEQEIKDRELAYENE